MGIKYILQALNQKNNSTMEDEISHDHLHEDALVKIYILTI